MKEEDVLLQINPFHLQLLRPLIKWKILSIKECFDDSAYPSSYKSFHKIIQRLEKNGVIGSFKDVWTKTRRIYLKWLGNEMVNPFDWMAHAFNKQNLFHDSSLPLYLRFLATRTYDHYLHSLKRHILSRFGKLHLHEIKLQHTDLFIKVLSEAGHNARGINLIIGIFKRVLIEAVKENRLEKNPFQYLKELKEPPRPDVFLTGEEITQLLEASKGHYFYSLFLVSINTGMRRGELAGLCWDKVNFNTSLMELCRLRDGNGLGDRIKTVKSRRFIPMNAVVRSHLLELKKSSQSDYVFVDDENEPFDVDHLFREMRYFLKKAGISILIRFHDLRHTFASHFMMNGGNIYDLHKILGHTCLEMTQRYAHLAPEHLVQASNVVSFAAHIKSSANLAPSSLAIVLVINVNRNFFNGAQDWIKAFFRKGLTLQLHQVLDYVRLNVFLHFLSEINIQWHRVQKKW